jgi:protein-S-isoprenylcysteine O-methyltransferase Ste14
MALAVVPGRFKGWCHKRIAASIEGAVNIAFFYQGLICSIGLLFFLIIVALFYVQHITNKHEA